MTDGAKTLRVAHDWGDSVQLTDGRFGASFYLGEDGFVDFSGGLDPAIQKLSFVATDERRDAPVWFFSQNCVMAHNGYHATAKFRVWSSRLNLRRASSCGKFANSASISPGAVHLGGAGKPAPPCFMLARQDDPSAVHPTFSLHFM